MRPCHPGPGSVCAAAIIRPSASPASASIAAMSAIRRARPRARLRRVPSAPSSQRLSSAPWRPESSAENAPSAAAKT